MTVTANEFRAKRRQKFLSQEYFDLNLKALAFLMKETTEAIQERKAAGDLDSFGEGGIFKDNLSLLKLQYTAGCPIEQLKPLYADVIQSLGDWHAAEYEYSKWLSNKRKENLRLDMTPLEFEDLYHYQLALDVVSLGVLLGDGEALRRIALWMQSERGTDLLFESLLAPAIPDPRDNTDFYHVKPYDPLIDAFWTAETPNEASAKVNEYLNNWYKSFEGAPWHDGHLKAVEGEYMPYYGYWSFEAAAVCIIHDIDDSSFRDHIIYPKDLADWARANNSLAHLNPDAQNSTKFQRIPGGQPSPQTGWWHTPAKAGSRRYFKVGDVMPVIENSAYGETFWIWDTNQDAPKL